MVIAGAIASLVGVATVAYLSLSSTITELELKLSSEKLKSITAVANVETCKTALSIENDAKLKIATDLKKNMVELHIWKNKPATIKYVEIIQWLPRELKHAECEDVITGVRSINLNEL